MHAGQRQLLLTNWPWYRAQDKVQSATLKQNLVAEDVELVRQQMPRRNFDTLRDT